MDIKLPNELYQVVENQIVEIPTLHLRIEKFNMMSMILIVMILLVELRK